MSGSRLEGGGDAVAEVAACSVRSAGCRGVWGGLRHCCWCGQRPSRRAGDGPAGVDARHAARQVSAARAAPACRPGNLEGVASQGQRGNGCAHRARKEALLRVSSTTSASRRFTRISRSSRSRRSPRWPRTRPRSRLTGLRSGPILSELGRFCEEGAPVPRHPAIHAQAVALREQGGGEEVAMSSPKKAGYSSLRTARVGSAARRPARSRPSPTRCRTGRSGRPTCDRRRGRALHLQRQGRLAWRRGPRLAQRWKARRCRSWEARRRFSYTAWMSGRVVLCISRW